MTSKRLIALTILILANTACQTFYEQTNASGPKRAPTISETFQTRMN